MPPEQGSSASHGGIVADRAASLSNPVNVGSDTKSSYPCYACTVGSSLNMKKESERLKTYEHWPVPFMSPIDLAKAGFYYTQESDQVRCPFCGIEVGYWEHGDDPLKDHKKWSPKCEFVLNVPCGNIPLDLSHRMTTTDETSYDTCGPYGLEIRPFSYPERRGMQTSSLQLTTELEKLGITKSAGPVEPKYSTLESRIATFSTWPISNLQNPRKLAEAGFYYTGRSDQTKCFHCAGGLNHWEEKDDPWVEHAKWFSKCAFVNLRKGKEFVSLVTANHNAAIPAVAIKELENPSKSEAPAPITADKDITTSEVSKKPKNSDDATGLCKICFQEELGVVFLPCSHMVSCVKCAPSLNRCAVCREPLQATVRAYIS